MSKDNLLNPNRTPTLDELREFFRKNDWSSTTYNDFDYDIMYTDNTDGLEYIKAFMDEHFDSPIS